jgi:hypothetical protein
MNFPTWRAISAFDVRAFDWRIDTMEASIPSIILPTGPARALRPGSYSWSTTPTAAGVTVRLLGVRVSDDART